jgi:hypothetical protein
MKNFLYEKKNCVFFALLIKKIKPHPIEFDSYWNGKKFNLISIENEANAKITKKNYSMR